MTHLDDALKSVLSLGHPALRQRSQPISDPSHPHLQGLMDHLLAVMTRSDGVGIAAPQLGNAQRLIIVASRPNPRYPQAPRMEPVVMVNPQILAQSDAVDLGWEGCLSLPGVRGQVARARMVEVAYLDRWGQPQQVVWEGFVARILQHEYDHLEGVVFVDRVGDRARLPDGGARG